MSRSREDSIWRQLRWPFIAVALVMVYGVAGYMLLEGWSFIDALYMTVTTLTTVGFREVRPLDASGRAFTITLVVAGVAVFLVALALVAGYFAETDRAQRSRRKRMQRRIDRLQDHFVICAYGRVGRTAAREFEVEGVPFVAIDAKEELEEQMVRDGVPFISGDPTQEGVLREAGVERARGLVCAVDSDADNVYITLMARALNPGLFIVARASETEAAERLYRAGADRVNSPYVSSGRHMASLAMRPRVVDYLEVATAGDKPLRLEEMQVEEGSPFVGRTVFEVCGEATALAVRHPDGRITTNPEDGLMVGAGDLLVLLGGGSELRPMEER